MKERKDPESAHCEIVSKLSFLKAALVGSMDGTPGQALILDSNARWGASSLLDESLEALGDIMQTLFETEKKLKEA